MTFFRFKSRVNKHWAFSQVVKAREPLSKTKGLQFFKLFGRILGKHVELGLSEFLLRLVVVHGPKILPAFHLLSELLLESVEAQQASRGSAHWC